MPIGGRAARPGTHVVPPGSRGEGRRTGGWSRSFRRRAALTAAAVGAVAAMAAGSALAAGSASGVATGTRLVTVYSVATGVQYINTEDDRVRGHLNNPLDPAANKLAPKSSGTGNGPFAGDVAIYALSLYANPTLKRSAGSAVYTCYFNYDQHALCKAYFKLKAGGTLVASGSIDFKSSKFEIVVTGGTNKYLGARGEVAAAAAQRSSKIDFRLIG
jgi:hypothetical protein